MGKKKRVNIYVDVDEWEKLSRNINCSKSEWINQQIKKQNECIDEIDKINNKIQKIESLEKELNFDKTNLIKQKESILKQREENEHIFEIVEDAMTTVRKINHEQGFIEDDRVKHIASNHTLNPDVLFKQIEKEQIKHENIEIHHQKIDYSSKGGQQRK